MRMLYSTRTRAFPYADLLAENARRKATQPGAPEYELVDTGAFDGDRYFDVEVEYAKREPGDILIRIIGNEPRAGGASALPAADAVVPQHLELAGRLAQAEPFRDQRHGGRRRTTPRWVRSG